MFALGRIIALISLCGVPVQLSPTYNQKIPTAPKSIDSTTPKSIRFPEQFFRHVYNKPLSGKTLKELQYAPLHMNLKPDVATRKTSVETTTAIYGKLYNEHLEPRTPDAKHEYTKCYKGPAEHVDIMTSVSRSPGHNAIYRGFPLIVPKDKPFKAHKRSQDVVKKPMPMKKVLKKLNFIKPYGEVQNSNSLPMVSTTAHFLNDKLHGPPRIINNPQYILNPEIVDKDTDLTPNTSKLLPFSPYNNKFHRLHLNIARVYSPGAVPQKSPSYAGVYSLNIDTENAELQSDQPRILHLTKQNHEPGKTVVLKLLK